MFKYFYQNKKLLFISTLISKLIFAILFIFVSIILSKIIDIITLLSSNNNILPLLKIFTFTIIYTGILFITMFVQQYLTAKLIKKIMLNIREDLMKGILNNSIIEYKQNNIGDYISLFNNNISKIETNYFKNILEIYSSILTIIFAIITLIYINPIITILALLIMILPTVIPKIFNRKLILANENVINSFNLYNSKIKEIFDGFETVKNYNIENVINNQNKDIINLLENSKFYNENLMNKLSSISMLVGVFCQFLILIISGCFCILNLISVGQIIAITQLSGEVISQITLIINKISEIKGLKSVCNDLLEKINKNIDVSKNNSSYGDIIFQNVSFKYNNNDNLILKNFNYTFQKGKKYVIVGETGSGKSTILKLIVQYYNDYLGNIYIDNENIKNINVKNCSYLQQNNFLFNDTIKNNITMFKNIDDSKLNNIIEKCQLNNILDKLQNKNIGENGNLLSGGEKQRICIARTLFNKKDILLMDEATSALDNETFLNIENNILNINNIIYISICHRLKKEVLEKFDKILVIKNGELIEEGNFNTLINNKKYFYSLYN